MRRMIDEAAAPSRPRSRCSAVSYRSRAISRWPAASARPASSISVATSGERSGLPIASGDGAFERRGSNHLLRDCRAGDAQQPRRCRLIATGGLRRERHGLGDDVVEQLAARWNANFADRVGRRGPSRTPLNHEILGAYERRIAAQNRRALDHVLQLAHVTGPAMDAQRRVGVRREFLTLLVLAVFLTQEVPCDDVDVLDAVAKGWQEDREDVEPIIQVLTELAARDDLLENRARRRDDPALDRNLLKAAEPPDLTRLQRAEQLGLEERRQVMYFVKEERAGTGQLEQSLLARMRAGEGAALVTEQLRLEERVRNRRAVDCDKGVVGGGTRVMNASREELFSRAGFADQQNCRAACTGHLLRESYCLAKHRALADDVLKSERLRSSCLLGSLVGQPYLEGVSEVLPLTQTTIPPPRYRSAIQRPFLRPAFGPAIYSRPLATM